MKDDKQKILIKFYQSSRNLLISESEIEFDVDRKLTVEQFKKELLTQNDGKPSFLGISLPKDTEHSNYNLSYGYNILVDSKTIEEQINQIDNKPSYFPTQPKTLRVNIYCVSKSQNVSRVEDKITAFKPPLNSEANPLLNPLKLFVTHCVEAFGIYDLFESKAHNKASQTSNLSTRSVKTIVDQSKISLPQSSKNMDNGSIELN